MINKAFIKRHIGNNRIFERGENIFYSNDVGDLMVFEQESSGLTEIETWVNSSNGYDTYQVRVLLGKNDNIITEECTCPYFEDNFEPCKHIAAVLLKYIDEDKLSTIGNGYTKDPVSVQSDFFVQGLINTFSKPTDAIQPIVHITPTLNCTNDEQVEVSFALNKPGSRSYVIKSIDSFCTLIHNKENKYYGKYLEFVHTIDAFDMQSKPVIEFLMSLYYKDDSYMASNTNQYYNYGYYGYMEQTMKRCLCLRGRYLDAFMNLIQDQNIIVSSPLRNYDIPFRVEEGIPEIHTSLTKKENGCILQGIKYPFALGNEHIYIFDYLNSKIFISNYNNEIIPLLRYLSQVNEKPEFISEEDLPKFSKYVYPVISKTTLVKNDGFDPYDYVIEKPSFELYLDSPQKDAITCEIKAIYNNAVYNTETDTDLSKRDQDEEALMVNRIAPSFNALDELNHKFVFHGDDEGIYTFVTATIPYLQSLATVYISDALKRITIKAMPKVNVGVSVNHDLLRLDLVSDTLSMKEIAEILSKYDKKKKFYRLKDGTFLNTEASNIDELLALKDSLSLSQKELEKGTADIPKFRAMYLETLNDKKAYNLDYDTSFRRMIQQMHTINQEDYEPPIDLNAEMRPYQLHGMQWLCALRDNGFGGLLADEMGLGKTLQVIAMLGTWKDRKRTLIVCPASLVYNWSKEIDKFLPSIPHRMIQGTPEERKELIQTSSDNEVLITSYELLRRDIDCYEDMQFSCEVIDEAQYIKNANTQNSQAVKYINASFKIALTGTPIENRLSELWSIFDYLMPGFFYSYRTFRERFETPIVRDHDDLMERELTQMITPFVLRRLKKDVLKDLPDKLEEVYYAQLEGEQKKLYEAEVQKIKLLVGKQSDQEFKENKFAILAELTKLRQLCCYPGLLYDKYRQNSAKTDMGIDLICNAIEGGHKILLFSQFTTMLDKLSNLLNEKKIPYYKLEGKTSKKKRAEMVEAFQNDDVPVFLISLKAGGTGLNLTAADIVIHYDPWWNTAVENQASDRAHRIGQTNVVTVYKLIMKDTIEERILELQASKSDLANKILSGDGISSSNLSRDDLLALL